MSEELERLPDLPNVVRQLPRGLSLEKPATNLASLTVTDSLRGLQTTVLAQWRQLDRFAPVAKYGITPINRLLFHGPPGNGKTVSCQWIAHHVGVPLYRVRSDQLVGAMLGETPGNIGKVMTWLEKQPPCVVLFDEIESLFPARTDGRDSCTREMSSALTVWWQHLDRWITPQLFVLATNLKEQLDPALVSRIELQVEFGPPTDEQARMVIRYWAETFHQYDADHWSAQLLDRLDSGRPFTSFRELWQTIQHAVRAAIVSNSSS
jgi:AAA+ superfamily predicted ATPase